MSIVVLLLEDPYEGEWVAMAHPDATMRESVAKTMDGAMQGLRELLANPLPLRFPDDMGPTPRQFEDMQRYGVRHSTDESFDWYVLDLAARTRYLQDLIQERAL